MLNDPTNQIPGSSSNPGFSTQPAFNQMPYYPNPNYQPQFTNQEELLMFQQFKMQQMHQQQPQQLPNQFTTSQPHSEQQSHHLEVEDTKDEDEPVPTPTSKPSRGGRLNSKAKKQRKSTVTEKQKKLVMRGPRLMSLLLAECFIQVPRNQKTGENQKRDTFLVQKSKCVQKRSEEKRLHERNKNMLREAHNNGQTLLRLCKEEIVFWAPTRNRSILEMMICLDHPVCNDLLKGQRTGSNSTASSGSNPAAYQEFMAEQYELDRKAKMTVLERESEDRRRLIQSQRIAEDMRVLQIDTRGMDAADAAIINAQKARIRAAYPPPPN
ncbi:hypothetical protein Tco_0868134 [Tanacetum coccineum]